MSTHEVPSDDTLESILKMRIRESDQLKTELAFFEQDSQQKNAPSSYQRTKTMEKKFFDQQMGAASFETRNERNRDGNTGDKQKQREVSQRRKETKSLLPLESKRKVYEKKTHAVSATMIVNVGILRALLLLLQNRRRTTMGKFLRKAGRPEAAAYLEKGFEDRARITSEIARNPLGTFRVSELQIAVGHQVR